jgi:glutamate/tyrosine decarboxylase-like PLP-dependent enzyme
LIADTSYLELVMEPELSVILFRRTGWSHRQYQAWSDAQLAAGTSFVVPTSWDGETVLRLCIVNPRTTVDDIRAIVSSLQADIA